MTCPQARTRLPVKIFVEENVVAPERITLKLLRRAKDRTPSIMSLVSQEDAAQAAADLLCHLKKCHLPSRSGWAFDFEVISIVEVVGQKPAHDKYIDGKPNRTAPVRVSAKQPRMLFGRLGVDADIPHSR